MQRWARTKGQGAFTVSELLIVVAIILILSTFSIVSYSSWHRRAKIGSAARQLKAICATTRAMAVGQNTNFQVAIDIDNREFWTDEVDNFGNVVSPKVIHPEPLIDLIIIREIRVNGITHTSGVARINFHPEATADYSQIYLLPEGAKDLPENYYTVRIFSSTALTRVYANEKR